MVSETALFKFFGLIWVLRWLTGQKGGGASFVPAAPQAPVLPGEPGKTTTAAPTPWPSTLPPFPSGWEYDSPVPSDVQTRAAALLPSLWAKGQGATAQEMTGGRWITYEAELVAGGHKGVTAWRVKGGAPAPSPAASPGNPTVQVPQVPVVQSQTPASPATTQSATSPTSPIPTRMVPAMTPVATAAVAMANALNANGYRKRDQQLYIAFQKAAGTAH